MVVSLLWRSALFISGCWVLPFAVRDWVQKIRTKALGCAALSPKLQTLMLARVFLPVVSARRGYRLWRLDAALGEKRPAEGGNLSFGDGVARLGWH